MDEAVKLRYRIIHTVLFFNAFSSFLCAWFLWKYGWFVCQIVCESPFHQKCGSVNCVFRSFPRFPFRNLTSNDLKLKNYLKYNSIDLIPFCLHLKSHSALNLFKNSLKLSQKFIQQLYSSHFKSTCLTDSNSIASFTPRTSNRHEWVKKLNLCRWKAVNWQP